MKKIVTSIIALGLTSLVYAGDYSMEETPSSMTVDYGNGHNEGLYISGAAGWTKQDIDEENGGDLDYSEFGGRLGMGYAFKVNNQLLFGPEIGWGYYGKVDEDVTISGTTYDGDLESSGYDLLAVAQYYVDPKIDAIVKVGAVYARSDTSATLNDGIFSISSTNDDEDTVPMIGFGAGYDLTPRINVNAMYYHIFGQDDDSSDFEVAKTNSIFVGLMCYFN